MHDLQYVAALLVPICSMISAIVAAAFSSRAQKQSAEATSALKDTRAQLSTSDGTSLGDRLDGYAHSLATTLELVKSQGHQIGELNENMSALRRDVQVLQTKQIFKC